jgi:hypothetical protein
MSVLHGNGDGTFRAKVEYPGTVQPTGIAVADVTGDGKVDIVTSDDNTDTISVLTGNGDGTFQDKVEYPAGWVARSVAAVDLNHDGHPDLVVMNAFAKTVRILLATCLR